MEISHDNPISALNAAGFTGTLATNSELEFVRYLRPGDHLSTTNEVESISPKKTTALGQGYFVTWVTTYTAGDEVVGRQLVPRVQVRPAHDRTRAAGDEARGRRRSAGLRAARDLDGDRSRARSRRATSCPRTTTPTSRARRVRRTCS
jgi:hypothetical protein